MGRITPLLFCLSLAPGCGSEASPEPALDAASAPGHDLGAAAEPDTERHYCGDRICDYPKETIWNCTQDCRPRRGKSDDPFAPYDPGFVDPVPIDLVAEIDS